VIGGVGLQEREESALADYEIPEDLYYTREDEWARPGGDQVVVGITDYAQQQLGDIVFVELPEVGAVVTMGENFGVIESVKAVSGLTAPISGEVVSVNGELADRPDAVNESCYGDGWLCAIQPSDDDELATLLDAHAYRTHIDERSEPDE
jgi:glycine cleavage system H protein